MEHHWNVPADTIAVWLESCRDSVSSDPAFAGFRKLPGIQQVTDNKPDGWGKTAWEMATHIMPSIIDHVERIQQIDAIGSPYQMEVAAGVRMNPATAYHCYIVALMAQAELAVDGDVAEIGGGYGMGAAVLHELCRSASHTIIDLQEAAALQRRFLDAAGCRHIETGSTIPARDFDLCFSIAAISELDAAGRAAYEPVIKRSHTGYLQWCNPEGLPPGSLEMPEAVMDWLVPLVPHATVSHLGFWFWWKED